MRSLEKLIFGVAFTLAFISLVASATLTNHRTPLTTVEDYEVCFDASTDEFYVVRNVFLVDRNQRFLVSSREVFRGVDIEGWVIDD